MMTGLGRLAPIRENFSKIVISLSSLLLLAILSLTIAKPALAEGGLVVTPTLLEFGDADRYASLSLVNRGDKPATYRISVVNRRMLPNGQIEPATQPAQGEHFADSIVRFSPRQVTVTPGTIQTVRVMVVRPKDMQDGEYRSHLLFEQIPDVAAATPANTSPGNTLGIQVIARFGISIPLIVRHGHLSASAQISKVEPQTKPDGSKFLSLVLNREGNESIRGDLVASADGRQIGLIRNLAVYLSSPYRQVDLAIDSKGLSGQRVVLEYRARKQDGGALLASSSTVLP